MNPSLSFEQAPPISVPYRFFLTAPLFGAAAGLVLVGFGPAALESRWAPGALAMTHLIVVDFMLQVMCGALLQFVAVVAGANIWRPQWVASIVHPLITAGAIFLVSAFLLDARVLFLAAALTFAGGLGLFIAVIAVALIRTPAKGMAIHVLRLAVFGLLVTVSLGVTLATTLGWHDSLQSMWSVLKLVNVHVAWGLAGWALMLVIGVSYLVVPMFQLTPSYPVWFTRALPAGLLAVLVLWSLQLAAGGDEPQSWQSLVLFLGMLIAGLYGAATLWLQSRRRRKQADVTLVYWRIAMVSLVALACSWIVFQLVPALGAHPRAPLWIGVLALPGLFLSVIVGMLYKIVPFLNWLHLQRLVGFSRTTPNMKQMMPEGQMRGQMRVHLAALGLLLAAVIWPLFAVPAGLVFAGSCLWLELNLVRTARLYARLAGERKPSDPPAA